MSRLWPQFVQRYVPAETSEPTGAGFAMTSVVPGKARHETMSQQTRAERFTPCHAVEPSIGLHCALGDLRWRQGTRSYLLVGYLLVRGYCGSTYRRRDGDVLGITMAAHPYARTDMYMTTEERRSYVCVWSEGSGLIREQVREIATLPLGRPPLLTARRRRWPTGFAFSRCRGLGGDRRSGRFVAARRTSSEVDGARTGQEPASVGRGARVRRR